MTAPKATKKGQTPAGPDEDELRRWTPEEVIAKRWLPYKSARVLKERCYRHEVICHDDGGRITFTLDDIRRENARTARTPRRAAA